MPAENLEEQGLEKNPDLNLAQLKFKLTLSDHKNDAAIKEELMQTIEKENMAPFYEECCRDLGWQLDSGLLDRMKKENESELKTMNESIDEAEKSMGETEIREANLKKAEYLSRTGDKEEAIKAFAKTYDKTVSLGQRLDLVFHNIRLGLFYLDHSLITRNLEKAKSLIEEGGDWDRRNRLKVYEGVYCMAVRDFKKAATLFLDTISTFTSYELMDYTRFVGYTVLVCMISLPRNDLRTKVVKGSEIQEVLHSAPDLKTYLLSLYECQYQTFFQKLAWVESELRHDRLLAPHYRYYVREMRILAYTQLLESYRSLTLQYMATAFGVSTEFIDRELSRYIAASRLHCKIDKVGGIVETNRPDSKNWQYQAVIKHGDILLNRVQKLSRVINI
ncbi:26S proteasome non-ATPase regulatory subunit 6 [Chionoecetes opilio]|uniref:26S proteasome non-ATPase regulatory subunit 6 n=1 Tax=Chionoecetes opilio TaxID=41210 RepID=A0A8J5CY10_CHIOP|nr:26S proteasome non-ATPase regulatory subunit 6 [Chionoecetes opilio]